jgi:hypothetical protein
LTASIRRQGFSRKRKFIQHLKDHIRRGLSHGGYEACNAAIISGVVPANAGTHTPRPRR